MFSQPIYKLTSTGNVQIWQIEVDGNKYRTKTGLLDGKSVISAFTECEGKNIGKKNATTGAMQAMLEAAAKRKKKLESGYYESIEEIKPKTSPMLAEDFDDERLTFPVFIQPKLDGIRCNISKSEALSRNLKPITSAGHIQTELAPIFAENVGLVFDGELYNHELKKDFNKVVSLVKNSTKNKKDEEQAAIREEAAAQLQYWVYDIQDINANFSARYERLKAYVEQLRADNEQTSVVLVPTYKCDDIEQLLALFNEFIADGYEGAIIRSDTVYEFKRTFALMKLKNFITEEFPLVRVIEGKGNKKGCAGKVEVMLKDGTTSCASMTGDRESCKKFLEDADQNVGKPTTIKFQGYTPAGKIRFGEFVAIRDYE